MYIHGQSESQSRCKQNLLEVAGGLRCPLREFGVFTREPKSLPFVAPYMYMKNAKSLGDEIGWWRK